MPGQRGNAGTWSGRLAVPLMLWYGGFSSLGVSLAYHFDRHSLSRSWSIQAGSAPTAEGPEVLVSWWWTGGAVAVEAFLKRRTWSGRLAVPLMPWHGGFSSLGVSLASDHKATQEG